MAWNRVANLVGPQGANAFSETVESFTLPDFGETVEVDLLDASWVVVGQIVYVGNVPGLGEAEGFKVIAKVGNKLTLLRPQPPPSIGLSADSGNIARLGSDDQIYVGYPLPLPFALKGITETYVVEEYEEDGHEAVALIKNTQPHKKLVLDPEGWIGWVNDSSNPREAWVGLEGDELQLLNDAGPIRLAQPTTVDGGLTVTGGANLTGAFTANTQDNWATFNSNGAHGIQLLTPAYDGIQYYKEMLHCNPGWDHMYIRAWHVLYSWAGICLMLGGSRYDLRHDGQIMRSWDGATVVWVASDARNKRDIGPCEGDALEVLRKIPIEAYTQIKDGIRRAIGWVAQSVEKVLPDWVQEVKSSDLNGNPIVTKRVEPNDQGLPYLIQAIQQLDKKFTKFEERLTKWERT